jgi:diguanylate cyclase (GGDEF)-like protein
MYTTPITTMSTVFQVACFNATPPDLSTSPYGPFVLQSCDSLEALGQQLREESHDALLLEAGGQWPVERLLQWSGWAQAALDCAIVVVAPEPHPQSATRLILRGAQDVVPLRDANASTVARVLRLAIERKRLEVSARRALSTDLATGLPNLAQLQDHINQLLALREREPAPMALLVLRIDDMLSAEKELGQESANVLRRQLAERLRAGLRASDVVASIGGDAFAVLLAWIDAPEDGEQVADKMALAAQRPFKVAGRELTLSVGLGVSQFPAQGRQADELLRLALDRASGTHRLVHTAAASAATAQLN